MRLVDGGPFGLTRQLERLLPLLGFEDVANIDGSGDQGADVLGRLADVDWVFQCKWRKNAGVDDDAVDEVWNAMQEYGIDRGVVVTNATYTKKARQRVTALRHAGVNVTLWDGAQLQTLHGRARSAQTGFSLYEYQRQAIESAWSALQDANRALVFLATGLGKTVVAGRVIAQFLESKPGGTVLVCAHTNDLVDQLERAMWRDLPKSVPTRLLNAESKPHDLAGVSFAVLPTAASYIRAGFVPDLIVVDEAHHVGEIGYYAEVFSAVPETPRLGVTATPWRGDRFDIESVFGPAVVRVSISDGMRLGYLADVRYRLFADNIDWDFVRDASENGYSIKDLNKRLFIPERDEAVRDRLLEVWEQTVEPRAIVFCQTIAHAEEMAEQLRKVPGWARSQSVHAGLTKRERQRRLLRFRSGDVPILTSVDLLNEGVDVPDVNILCFARVTHSRRIFIQQLGRGLRIRSGKTQVEVLDFVSDLRRLAELHDLRQQVSVSEIEHLSVARNQFLFDDRRIESLLQQWIEDVGDLAIASDSVRLEFPPVTD